MTKDGKGYDWEYSIDEEDPQERYDVPLVGPWNQLNIYDVGNGPEVDMVLRDCVEDWAKNVDLQEWDFPLVFSLWRTTLDDEMKTELVGKAVINMEYTPSFTSRRVIS